MTQKKSTTNPESSHKKKGEGNAGNNYTVLVPVHKRNLFQYLLAPAIQAARKYGGKIILLNVIEIPYETPPSAAEETYLDEREEFLKHGLGVLKKRNAKGKCK